MANQAKKIEDPFELVDFPVEKLVDNSHTDFDLFIRLRDHLILYSGFGYSWQRDELNALLGAGHQYLLLRPRDMERAQTYEKLVRLPQVDLKLPPRERIVSIEQVGAEFMRCLFSGALTPACVNKAESIAGSLVECVIEDPGCVKELRGLADHDFYTYSHSIRVAAYSVAIAMEMGAAEKGHLNDIALGGVFHDVGKSRVSLDVINKAGPLTEDEWELMRNHPIFGYQTVAESVLSQVSREIVLHHHERLDGTGYPDGIGKGSLLTEVLIATMADVYDALTSARAYQRRRTRYEALDYIKHKLLGSKIPTETFRALVQCLADT